MKRRSREMRRKGLKLKLNMIRLRIMQEILSSKYLRNRKRKSRK